MSVAAEQNVRNRIAISLLFYEAYTNFIDGNLPCTESDGVNVEAVINVYWRGSLRKTEKVINVVIMGLLNKQPPLPESL